MFSQDDQKSLAGYTAVDYVDDGMIVGLGTGSTAKFAVDALAEKVAEGLEVEAVPTSLATKEQAERMGIQILGLDEVDYIDLTIDGADQIDKETGVCIKGGGGAHYIEKQVARKSDELIIIVDESKVVDSLAGYNIPLEIDPDKVEDTISMFEHLKRPLTLRDERSDSGNIIGDAFYDGKMSIEEFETVLMMIEGVIDTGIFLDMTTRLVIGKANGKCEVIDY